MKYSIYSCLCVNIIYLQPVDSKKKNLSRSMAMSHIKLLGVQSKNVVNTDRHTPYLTYNLKQNFDTSRQPQNTSIFLRMSGTKGRSKISLELTFIHSINCP